MIKYLLSLAGMKINGSVPENGIEKRKRRAFVICIYKIDSFYFGVRIIPFDPVNFQECAKKYPNENKWNQYVPRKDDIICGKKRAFSAHLHHDFILHCNSLQDCYRGSLFCRRWSNINGYKRKHQGKYESKKQIKPVPFMKNFILKGYEIIAG